jgi:N-acyl-L-homoserine lactone synthetase
VSRFGAIKSERAGRSSGGEKEAAVPAAEAIARTPARVGKKAISGYFSAEMSRDLHRLGLEQDKSLQALMGEALDDLLRKYGKHPYGER